MSKGRHGSASPGSFYRDLVMMVVGILLVVATIGGLVLVFRRYGRR